MESNYKMLQCGYGLIRYIRDKEDGQLWFSLTDTFNALQVPARLRDSSIFNSTEIAQKVYYHDKLKKPLNLLSLNQAGLFKIILRSDSTIFREFKTWLADKVLGSLGGEDYMLNLMPYIQGFCNPNSLLSIPASVS